MNSAVVKITKNLREKFGFANRAIVEESTASILLKPFPDISEEKGSLRAVFKGRTAREVIEETRVADITKESRNFIISSIEEMLR